MSPALGTNPLRQTLFKRTVDESDEEVTPALESDAHTNGPSEVPELARELPPSIQTVAFDIGGTRFGVDIQQVSCIVRMVEITKVPRSPRYMGGIVNLRGQIVPVVSLQKLLGWPCSRNVMDMYIVVGNVGSKSLGLTVDSVSDLCDIDEEQLESPTETDRLAALLSWVAKLEDGIMFILDFEKIASLKDTPELVAKLALQGGEGEAQEEEAPPEIQAVLRERALALRQNATEEEVELRQFFPFILGKEKYAIDIGNVQKVLTVSDITLVPGAPDHFAGMINYGGDILWVLDLKRLIGLPDSLAGNDERVVVAEHGKAKFGFLADAVCDVVDFPTSAIRPPLASTEKVKDDYVAGEVHWDDDLIAILDFSALGAEKPAQGEQ